MRARLLLALLALGLALSSPHGCKQEAKDVFGIGRNRLRFSALELALVAAVVIALAAVAAIRRRRA